MPISLSGLSLKTSLQLQPSSYPTTHHCSPYSMFEPRYAALAVPHPALSTQTTVLQRVPVQPYTLLQQQFISRPGHAMQPAEGLVDVVGPGTSLIANVTPSYCSRPTSRTVQSSSHSSRESHRYSVAGFSSPLIVSHLVCITCQINVQFNDIRFPVRIMYTRFTIAGSEPSRVHLGPVGLGQAAMADPSSC